MAVVRYVITAPPHDLSNGGITCPAGRLVPVKQRVLKKDGTIWLWGTIDTICPVGFALRIPGFKLLDDISSLKPNAAPSLSCRHFTHSHETLLWPARATGSRH